MALFTGPTANKIGFLLCRVIVPLWVVTGALFKLFHASPKTLPKGIVEVFFKNMGMDLGHLLATILALEFFAAAVMFFIRPLARAMAIWMMTCFMGVLIWEMVTGNFASCGCFGKVTVSPWITFTVDIVLLLGVLAFGQRALRDDETPAKWPLLAATLMVLVMSVIVYVRIWNLTGTMVDPKPDPTPPVQTNNDGENGGENGGRAAATPDGPFVARTPDPLGRLVIPEVDTWVGKRWDELNMARVMDQWPKDITEGRWYVLWYSETCEHCHELLLYWFADQTLPAKTLTVAVPQSVDGYEVDGLLPNPCDDCLQLRMPVGSDYFFTPPILIAMEDGVVQCASEAEDAGEVGCKIFHGLEEDAAEDDAPAGEAPAPEAAAPAPAVDEGPWASRTPDPMKKLIVPMPDEWAGQRWDSLELARILPKWPKDINEGEWYVIYYSETCEHCHELLEYWFWGDDLAAKTLTVAIPQSVEGFETEGLMQNPCTGCLQMRAPVGADYFFTPPILIAIKDGVVQCASEAEGADELGCKIFHE